MKFFIEKVNGEIVLHKRVFERIDEEICLNNDKEDHRTLDIIHSLLVALDKENILTYEQEKITNAIDTVLDAVVNNAYED
jgi:hypothetical protein